MYDWEKWSTEYSLLQSKIDTWKKWSHAWGEQNDVALSEIWDDVFGEEKDARVTILSLSCGQGGKEAQSWKKTLCALFLSWCEQENFTVELVDDDSQGSTLRIENKNAWYFFKSQEGTHRFIRQSPFDKNQKVHTSYVDVVVEKEIECPSMDDIKKSDVDMSFMRSSGAGGQHVNKTESAVRLKHVPTGISVVCRQGRSQHMNRKIAWTLLQRRILEHFQHQQNSSDSYRKTMMDKAFTYHFGQNKVVFHKEQRSVSGVSAYLLGKKLQE